MENNSNISEIQNSKTSNINKTIWFLWYQGLEDMPKIVNLCLESWTKHNPDWKVVVLSFDNLKDFLPEKIHDLVSRENVSLQAKSDIIRINLLKIFGGVWVDSTCYCCQPLEDWLYPYLGQGFFAFSKAKGKYTLISSWFLAAQKESYLVSEYCKITNDYWLSNPDLIRWNSFYLLRIFLKVTRINVFLFKNPQYWFKSIFTKVFKVHPYWWFHYLFEKMLIEDRIADNQWKLVPEISADIPHSLYLHGFLNEMTDELKLEISNCGSPLYKLNWRIKPEDSPVLRFLFSNVKK